MSLFSTLSVAGRALGASRVVHATASHNIENAGTAGYARQRVELTAAQPATFLGGSFIGTGVNIGSIGSVRDRFLDAQVPQTLAAASFGGSAASTMTALNTLDPDDPFGLPASLGNFFAAMRQLSIAPADAGYRRAAVAGAEALASTLNRASNEVIAARNAADESLAAQTQDASRLAARVASLNAQVRKARASGAEPNDLLDQRLKAAEDLASLTGATISAQDGDMTIRLGAVSLVSGDRAATFSTSPIASNGGHLAVVVSGSDGASQIMDNDAVGGRLGGVLHGRDAGLGAVESRIDRLAFDFAAQVNAAHRSAVGLDGSTGRDLMVVGGVAGAAGRIEVDPAIVSDPDAFAASATGAPGDAGGVYAMLATENSATGDIATLIGDFGAAARTALDEADAANGALTYIVGMRDSATGVSIDEELVEITKAQRTFEAVSKVLQTADSMLNDLLSLR